MGKFSLQNDGKHIHHVLTVECKKHRSDAGEPCFAIFPDSHVGVLVGACGDRIRRAGYNGKISATSFQKSNGPRDSRKTYKKKEAA